jgi:uncharacterized protein RhaS with RHS repeats
VRTVCGRTLNYDLTGNVVSDGLRSYNNYTAFNLPLQIQGNGNTLDYTYDADHQRLTEKVTGTTGAADSFANPAEGTTTYVGLGFFEAFQPVGQSNPSRFRHFIGSPEGIVAVVSIDGTDATESSTNTKTRYWAKDHLGSIVAEYAENATDIQRYSYDVWGR